MKLLFDIAPVWPKSQKESQVQDSKFKVKENPPFPFYKGGAASRRAHYLRQSAVDEIAFLSVLGGFAVWREGIILLGTACWRPYVLICVYRRSSVVDNPVQSLESKVLSQRMYVATPAFAA